MSTRAVILAGLIGTILSACSEPPVPQPEAVRAGQRIYAMECAACHGADAAGRVLPGGVVAPDLAGLRQRNDGYFPREFVSRFVMGRLEKEDPSAPMPDFSAVGLAHVYPQGGADGEVLETDFANLLDYLEAIQR